MGATAALFDIRKRNVLTADPANTGYSVAAGEIRSRGLEFDFSGQLTTNWRVNASLVLNDVEITKDNTLEVGGRLLNVPRVNGSVLAVYEDGFANGQRYGIGGGVTHMGKRLGQARTQAEADAGTPAFDLPAYTTAKLVAYWRINPTPAPDPRCRQPVRQDLLQQFVQPRLGHAGHVAHHHRRPASQILNASESKPWPC